MERSAHFVEILERYGGEVPVLSKVHRLFREEAARRAAREERESGTATGADDALQPYFVVQEWLAPSVAGLRGVLGLRVTVLTGGERAAGLLPDQGGERARPRRCPVPHPEVENRKARGVAVMCT